MVIILYSYLKLMEFILLEKIKLDLPLVMTLATTNNYLEIHIIPIWG